MTRHFNQLEKTLGILKGALSERLYSDLKFGIKAFGEHIATATKEKAIALCGAVETAKIKSIDYKEVNAFTEFLDGNKEEVIETWKIAEVDKYYYLSGKNQTTYIETTFWYNQVTRERKETERKHSCVDNKRIDRPSWARGITKQNKSLNYK